MPEIKRVFNIGKMNRDLDDRIIPAGEYREAFNVNISQSEGSDVGAIENLLGNELVAPVGAFAWQFDGISGSQCIGSYKDNGNERIYFFVTSNTSYDETNPSTARHGIYEYNQKAKQLTTLVYTNQLNFHEEFLHHLLVDYINITKHYCISPSPKKVKIWLKSSMIW